MGDVREVDVVVVGGGVHGSSAAYHLARDGKNTLLIEQFPLPHSRGSSHGQTRIIRQVNYGEPALGPLMNMAYRQWKEIEKEAGETLMHPSPLLALGSTGCRGLMDQMAGSVEAAGYTPQWLSPQRANDMFGLGCSEDTLAFLDPSAGILMADKCVSALQRLFRASGGRVLDGWRVEEVVACEGGVVEVRGEKGMVRAGACVLCPGPWAGRLLGKLGVHLPLRVERISVLYWQVKRSLQPPPPTTSFVDVSGEWGHFYGLPDIEYPGLMKLCFHGGPEVDPDRRDEGDGAAMRAAVQRYVKAKFPCLEPNPVVEESCLYTTTPDTEFILDTIPRHSNIIYAAGFSGTGFKIGPAVGECLSRLVQGKATPCDLSAFRLARFNKSKM